MRHLLSKRWTILLVMLMPLLISLACTTVLNNDPQAGSQESNEVIVEADLVYGPGTFNFPDTKAGLADLPSYKATLTLTFDGTRDGQAEQWSKTYVLLATKEPVARQLTIEKAGDLSDLETVLMVEVDGAAYERTAENACNANVIDPQNSQIEQLEPAGFLTGVIGAEAAGTETVNNIASDHYTFDERAFGQLDIAQSTGELWIAADGGFIVRYLVTTKGNADYFGEGIEGTLTWDYQLTDVNQPVTFALPDDCPAGMVNAPLMADASDVLNVPSLLSYDTSSSLAEAAAFYQEQIPGLGWTLLGEPAIGETTALMEFTQEDQTMTIIMTVDNDRTTINIVLDRAQK